jgi:atypical dual specificity phosphatase
MDRFGLLAPRSVVALAGRALFWPIACSQFILGKFGLYGSPYNLVYEKRLPDGRVGKIYLGGIPWPSEVRDALIEKEKIACVLNLVSERKIDFPTQNRLDLPMTDFVHPSIAEVTPAVEFIDKCVNEGKNVYVHCRAGKGRSATVVMCWLVSRAGMDPVSAQELLSKRRPQVLGNLCDRDVVREFYNKHSKN